MTTLRAPGNQKLSRRQLRLIASLVTVLTFVYLAFMVHAAWVVCQAIGQTLLSAPTRQAGVLTTWGAVLGATTPTLAMLKCQMNTVCGAWFGPAFQRHFDLQLYAAPFLGLFLGMAYAWRAVPDGRVRKNPGQGKWFGVDDPQAGELLPAQPKGRAAVRALARQDATNPRSLYVGHVIPSKQGVFVWNAVRVGFLRERDRHENVLIMGAPGSGKTRGVFRQNIALDALYGRTSVVFDMKWPQLGSGFGDLALFWQRAGRPVYVFAPFSDSSMRLPLLEGIDNLDEALKLARAIIAPPEYREETGAYFKDNERRALAAMILAIAQGPTPNMKELQRLGQMNYDEFENWYRKQQNPEIQSALKAIWDQRKDRISETLAGVVNKLAIFYTEAVSRATSAGNRADELIDLRTLFRDGGLLLIGIEGKHILDGNGEILLQLIKRRIDRALLDVADESAGGRLPRTATYYLDELPSLGRLPYLMTNLSTLRSRGVCMMLGVQNSEQGSVVYSRDYWKALSTNNIGTRVEFVRGTSGDDARSLSEEIGETTVEAETQSKSGHALWNVPWSAEARKGQTVKLEKRPLLSVEEIKRFPRDLAVVFAKGQNPVLVATPSLDSPTLELITPDGRSATVKNELYGYWAHVMNGVTDVEAATRALVTSLGVQRRPGEVSPPVRDARGYWQEWLTTLLHGGARVRRVGGEEKMKLMLRRDSLPEGLDGRDVNYFIGEGWLNLSDSEEELTITQDGLKVAGKLLTRSLTAFEVLGPALYWARTHAGQVAGYPGGAVREDAAVARYTPETLLVPEHVARQVWGVVPDLPREELGGRRVVRVSLSDPAGLAQAIERASGQVGDVQREAGGEDQEVKKGGEDVASPATPPEGGAPTAARSTSTSDSSHPQPFRQDRLFEADAVRPGEDVAARLADRLGQKKPGKRGQA